MADFYVNALETLMGVSALDAGSDVTGTHKLGAAANRLSGARGPSLDVADGSSVNFGRSGAYLANGQLADIWEVVRRGNQTFYFTNATDSQGRYHAAAEARANELVASFAGDAEDIAQVRDRILRGESLDSILADVKGKRQDLNIAAAVARDRSRAEATANNDIVDPNIKESSAVADARNRSDSHAEAEKEGTANAVAREQSSAHAHAGENSSAQAQAHRQSLASSTAFQQSQASATARNDSEAQADANNGAKAQAEADQSGTSISNADNDARATARSRGGEAEAKARDGSTAQAQAEQERYLDFEVGKDGNTVWAALRKAGWSDREILKQNLVSEVARQNKLKDANVVQAGQKLRIERKQDRRPTADAEAVDNSTAKAHAEDRDSHAGVLADMGAEGQVHTRQGQSQDLKATPPRQPDPPDPGAVWV